jgi:uncharacterized protein YabE (DUF348 family)
VTGSSEVWSAVSGSRSPRDGGAAFEGPGSEGPAFDGGTAFGGPAFHGTAQGSGGTPDGFGDPAQFSAYTEGAYTDAAYSDAPDHSVTQFSGQSTAAGGYPDGGYPNSAYTNGAYPDSAYSGSAHPEPGFGQPYAPYANGGDEYADPYSGQYSAEPHAQSAQYHSEASGYEDSAHPASEYESTAYPNAASGYADGAYAQPGAGEYERTEYPEFESYGSHAAHHAPDEARQEQLHAEQYAEAAAPGRGRRGRTRTAAPGDPGFEGGYGAGFDAEFEAEFGPAGRGPAGDLAAPARFPGPRSPEPGFAPRPDRGEGAGHAGSPEPIGFTGERDGGDDEAARPTRGRSARRPITTTKPRVSLAGKAVRGLVLAALIGGVVTYVALDKTVTLSVDGSVSQIHTFDSTVGSVLAAQNITTGSHDLVSPAPTAHVGDSTTITVRYGRPLTVTVNGTMQHVWVHGNTVDAALEELGVRTTGAKSSMPMSAPIGRAGAKFSVYTMRHITFLVDGKTDQVDTTAATVTAAMAQAGITLHNQDAPSVPANSVPTENETITIQRITGTTEVDQVSIPYTVDKENDPTSYQGTVTVVTEGQDGVAQVTYAIQTINGVPQPKKQISENVTQQPVTEVEKVGTEALPTDASSLDWAALANCESGGNPEAVDPSGTYYGLYQFSVGTWDSLGGTGLPSQASSAEQTDLAELLYERSGSGQWPVCGHNLFS